MIDHTHKLIFIHIPKTAGTSIELSICGYDWFDEEYRNEKHITCEQARKIYTNNWEEYFKFSVVRNPWDMMVSWYKWRKLKCNYRDYLVNYNLHTQYVSTTKASDYLLDDDNKLQVDFVCRFENLQTDFETVCKKIGIKDVKLPHKNKTNNKHYTEYYDDETKQIVAEKYAKDIEYFGYKFGE